MENKIKTILIIFAAVLGASLFLIGSAFADDNLVVEFENTPLFEEANFLPGQGVTRWVKVINNSGQPQRIAVEAINYPGFPDPNAVPAGDLSRALLIVIREKGGSNLYGGTTGEKTLFNFYQDGETYLSSDIPTGSFKEYELEVIFPAEKEKEWQAATTTFDILVGFQGAGGQVPPGGGGGGGGGGLPPGLTIQYEKDFYIGTTTAKITWLTSYESTSRVIYDTQPGVFDLNNLPNYGYAYSTPEQDTPAATNGVTYHEIWLINLEPATTYYFRCVSHGSLAISTEHSFTTLWVEEAGERVEKGEMPSEAIGKEEELAFTEVTAGKEEKEEMAGGLETPELVEVGTEEPIGLGRFLATIGALPFNLKVILLIVGLILIGLLSLWLIKKKRKREE